MFPPSNVRRTIVEKLTRSHKKFSIETRCRSHAVTGMRSAKTVDLEIMTVEMVLPF
jgi:hypothetical protein